MALRATPTIAICLTAGIAVGVALARPGDEPAPAAATPVAAPATQTPTEPIEPENDSPYLIDENEAAAPVEAAPTAPAAPAAVGIAIEGFDFAPAGAVAGGTTIEVTNLDGADHTLTANDGAFDTGTVSQNQVVSFSAPTAPGTYAFFCEIHPSMTGQLVVS